MVYAWCFMLSLAGACFIHYEITIFAGFCFIVAFLTGFIFPLAMIDTRTHHIQKWVMHLEYVWGQRPKKIKKMNELDYILNYNIEDRL